MWDTKKIVDNRDAREAAAVEAYLNFTDVEKAQLAKANNRSDWNEKGIMHVLENHSFISPLLVDAILNFSMPNSTKKIITYSPTSTQYHCGYSQKDADLAAQRQREYLDNERCPLPNDSAGIKVDTYVMSFCLPDFCN